MNDNTKFCYKLHYVYDIAWEPNLYLKHIGTMVLFT